MMHYDAKLKTYREMPYDFVMIRHGESEANIVQHAEREGVIHDFYDEIAGRPDWQQRLTPKGIQQAKVVGNWLDKEFGGIENFDGCYVSPFLRTRETASYLGGDNWIVDDRIIERFRGVYGVASYQKAYESQQNLTGMFDISPWYARLDGAESLQDVFGRFRAFQNSIKRNHAREKVLMVSHGDFIKAAIYAIEWMLPETWYEANNQRYFSLPNCAVVHYTRVNPLDPGDIRRSINWRRILFLEDLANSPFGGQWQELNIKHTYHSQELRVHFEDFPPILPA